MTSHRTPRPAAPSAGTADEASPAGRAGAVGTVSGAIAAVPLLGPSLLAGCLPCVGVGAATGLGATSALPPIWWLAGLTATAAGTVYADRRHARRCQRDPAPTRTLAVLVAVAAASWLATRFVLLPALDWLTGGAAPPTNGPILP